jgi:hypothetical protein
MLSESEEEALRVPPPVLAIRGNVWKTRTPSLGGKRLEVRVRTLGSGLHLVLNPDPREGSVQSDA